MKREIFEKLVCRYISYANFSYTLTLLMWGLGEACRIFWICRAIRVSAKIFIVGGVKLNLCWKINSSR